MSSCARQTTVACHTVSVHACILVSMMHYAGNGENSLIQICSAPMVQSKFTKTFQRTFACEFVEKLKGEAPKDTN